MRKSRLRWDTGLGKKNFTHPPVWFCHGMIHGSPRPDWTCPRDRSDWTCVLESNYIVAVCCAASTGSIARTKADFNITFGAQQSLEWKYSEYSKSQGGALDKVLQLISPSQLLNQILSMKPRHCQKRQIYHKYQIIICLDLWMTNLSRLPVGI